MSSFQITDEADEWLDISTKEELLQNDINLLKEALNARTAQLDASNQLVQELSGHKTDLEMDRVVLQKALKESNEAFSQLENKLHVTSDAKASVEAKCEALEVALKDSGDMTVSVEQKLREMTASKESIEQVHNKFKATANTTIKKLEQEADDTKCRFRKIIEGLESKLSAAETTLMSQKEELSKTSASLNEVRRSYATEKKALALCSAKLDLANKSLGSVAILAEDRKDERFSLKRSVEQQKLALNNAKLELDRCMSQISSLQKELADVKSSSEQRINDLEASVNSKQKDLQDAREEVMVQQESLETHVKYLNEAREQIKCLESEITAVKDKASVLQQELDESRSQEDALRQELEDQKMAYEGRLDRVREALGFKKKTGDKAAPHPFQILSAIFNMPTHFKLV